jgi:hypothetical protein
MQTYKDGGTVEIKYRNKKYFIDYRIKSKTRGRVYNLYPGDAGAAIVDEEIENKVMDAYRKANCW